MLARAPGFSVVIILTLGLGIGANTAIFSLMDQVLLRSLPVHDPAALVQLDGPGPFSGRTLDDRTFSYPMYRDLRDGNTVFSGLVAQFGTPATLSLRDQSERVDAELVSGNTFDVLEVAPALGRALTPDDDRVPGGHPVAVLGHGYWQRRFAGDPSVIGHAVTINSTPMTIVGVAPPGFAGVMSTTAADVFVPLMMKAQLTPDRGRPHEPALALREGGGAAETGADRNGGQGRARRAVPADQRGRAPGHLHGRHRLVQDALP